MRPADGGAQVGARDGYLPAPVQETLLHLCGGEQLALQIGAQAWPQPTGTRPQPAPCATSIRRTRRWRRSQSHPGARPRARRGVAEVAASDAGGRPIAEEALWANLREVVLEAETRK